MEKLILIIGSSVAGLMVVVALICMTVDEIKYKKKKDRKRNLVK